MLASSMLPAPRCTTFCKHTNSRTNSLLCRDGKMYVPSDSFGGLSPEKKASQALESLLTFTAAKIVLAQLEGSGRGALAAYNQEGYTVLSKQLQEVSLRDPDVWLDDLLRKDKGIALRLMEVRAAYATADFEWDQLQRLSVKAIKDSNLALMRKAAAASLQATKATATAAAAVGSEAAAGAAACTAATAGQAAKAAALTEVPAQQQQEQEQVTGQDRAAKEQAAAPRQESEAAPAEQTTAGGEGSGSTLQVTDSAAATPGQDDAEQTAQQHTDEHNMQQ